MLTNLLLCSIAGFLSEPLKHLQKLLAGGGARVIQSSVWGSDTGGDSIPHTKCRDDSRQSEPEKL